MKKILLSVAVAGLFLATGCSKSPADKVVSLCNDYASKIDNAANCEEAQNLAMELFGELYNLGEEVGDKDMPEEDMQRIADASDKVSEAVQKKCGNE